MQGAPSSQAVRRKPGGMRRTGKYVAVTKGAAQSRHVGTDGLFTKPSRGNAYVTRQARIELGC
jgi:hypothetical protein